MFTRPDQAFVWGIDLKQALRVMNEHFMQLPEQERERGISAFAHSPPPENLVAELWDRFMRKGYRDEESVKTSPEKEAELVKRLKEFCVAREYTKGFRGGPKRASEDLKRPPMALFDAAPRRPGFG